MNYCKMQTWNTPINALCHYSITFITECHYASIIQRSCVNVPDSMPVVPGITHISLQSSFLCSIELNFFSWNRQLNGAPQWTRYKFCAKWMFDQCFMPNVRAEQTFVLPAKYHTALQSGQSGSNIQMWRNHGTQHHMLIFLIFHKSVSYS